MGSLWHQARDKSLWVSGSVPQGCPLIHRPAITVTTTRPNHTPVTGLILGKLR